MGYPLLLQVLTFGESAVLLIQEDSMKRIIWIVAIALMVSCSSPFGFNKEDYEINNFTLEEAWPMAVALNYIEDTKPEDIWKSPHETLRDGGGDCEDIAIYLMYLLGPDSSMLIMNMGTEYHALVKYHGIGLEPHQFNMTYNIYPEFVYREYDYYFVMHYATNGGRE
jgi:hypothetical protein